MRNVADAVSRSEGTPAQAESPSRDIERAAPSRLPADRGPHATWQSLFNGANLDGWKISLFRQPVGSDTDRIFQVENGAMHLYRDQADGTPAKGGFITSNEEYSYYHVRFEYKWGEKKFHPRLKYPRDAGLLYHAGRIGKLWPQSIECQVQENCTGDCYTVGNTQVTTTVDPGVRREGAVCYKDAKDGGEKSVVGGNTLRIHHGGMYEVPDDWNTVDVIVRGSEEVTYYINGHENFHATDLRRLDEKGRWVPLAHGNIVLQAEYAEVYYRNIEICGLPDGPLHPQPVEAITLQVPPEFEITRVAASPLVEYPTLACLDDRGRLYVSLGAGVNEPFDVLEKTLPRSIRRLEDTDGDGVYDRSTVFADRMTFPYGGVWHDGALYVASPPKIWRLADTDDDGVADQRDVVIGDIRSSGVASCMKGCYLAPDGWLYFCGGNEGGYDLRGVDGRRLRDDRSSPAVFRMRPDGSHLEVVATGASGVYDLCFDPTGDIFGITTITKYPRGDCLMHWVYGGVYPSPKPLSRNAVLTGPRLSPLCDWGQTSPSGLARYESDAFGEEYRGNLFTAHFNTHNVTRTIVAPAGASWEITREENFVSSDAPYCFLSDVLEDADGSLLVVETGSWFHIGCPMSPGSDRPYTGAIYRIRRKRAQVPDDPRGAKIAFAEASPADLARLLDDPRFVVRERSIAALAARGKAGVPALAAVSSSGTATARRNALWALTRIDHQDARAAVRKMLSDSDTTVRQGAVHSVGMWRDAAAVPELISMLRDAKGALLREAAGALGRCGDASAAPALFQAAKRADDRVAEHAIVFALVELSASNAALESLADTDPAVCRTALAVLEAVPHSPLDAEHLAPLLESPDRQLQQAALRVLLKHRNWNASVAGVLRTWVADKNLNAAERDTLFDALVARYEDEAVRDLVVDTLESSEERTEARELMLDVLARVYAKRGLPSARRKTLRRCLDDRDEQLVEHTIAVMAAVGQGRFDADLAAVALDPQRPQALQNAAALGVVGSRGEAHDKVFKMLLARCVDPTTEPVTRLVIARTLADARLSPSEQMRIAESVKKASSLELPLLLGAFDTTTSSEIGAALALSLARSESREVLPAGTLERLFGAQDQAVREIAAPLFDETAGERATRDARLNELSFALEGGDPVRGHDVFFTKAPCYACHRVGKEGARIGPELTKVADARTRRELLEAVTFPSATFAHGFESHAIVTDAATIVTGIIRRATRDNLYVLTAERSERAVPRDEIEEIVASRLSIMPQGLERALSPEDLRDLMAFLSSLKSEEAKSSGEVSANK